MAIDPVPDRRRASAALQRLALFLCAFRPAEAGALLEGLAEGPRQEAAAFGAEVRRWASARRQARLALEFGPREGAEGRLTALLEGQPPALRAALLEALPAEARARRRAPGPPEAKAPPALRALAERLVAEALDRR